MGAHSKRKEPRILRLLEGPWFFVVVAVVVLLTALGVGSYLIYDILGSIPVAVLDLSTEG